MNEQQVQADVETASRSLKAMSHPLRLMILCKLGEDEFSVQDIVDNVGTSKAIYRNILPYSEIKVYCLQENLKQSIL